MSGQSLKSDSTAAIAMVAVSSGKLPDASRILGACGSPAKSGRGLLGTIFGRKSPPAEGNQWQDGNLVCQLGDAHLAVSLMPAPIPWSDLEGPCETAWWWPEAEQVMRSHPYHFLVAVIGGSIEPVERRVLLTKAVREVVAGGDAVGVYWGEGTLVHEPKDFIRRSRKASDQDVPASLWIDVRVEPNSDGSLRCFTTGLGPLGFREIEVERSPLSPEDLLEFVGNTAGYIANNRLVIPDGDTMGRSATEQYKVRHGQSMFDRPDVMTLVMT